MKMLGVRMAAVLLLGLATAARAETRRDGDGDPLPKGALMRLGSARSRHSGGFGSVAYAPDGKLLASCGGGKFIHFWDPRTGREVRRLPGEARNLAFSPDGKILAAASYKKTACLWNVAKGELLRTLAAGPAYSIAFAHDGKMLATGEAMDVRLWDAATGRCLRTLTGHKGPVFSVSFSPDDRWLASTCTEENRVCVWEVKSGKLLREFKEPRNVVTVVRFTPDGKTLAAGSDKGPIQLWDTSSGKKIRHLTGHTSRLYGLIFTADGKTLISAGDDYTIRVWDVASGKQTRLLGKHRDQIYGLSLSPDEKTVASAGLDNVVRRWDLTSGKEIAAPAGHEHRITAVRFGDDGKTLISESLDGTRRVWDTTTAKERKRWDLVAKSRTATVALSLDGRKLAESDEKRTVRLRDRATGQQFALLDTSSHVHHLLFSPTGTILAGATIAGDVSLWDVESGKELVRVPKYGTMSGNMLFSPDGRYFATGGGVYDPERNVLRVWDTRTGKQIHRLTSRHKALFGLAVSADGRMMAGWGGDPFAGGKGEHVLLVWETATGGERVRFRGHAKQIQSAAFSADGKRLAAGEWGGAGRVWNLLSDAEPQCFQSGQGSIGCMSFSADGARLACGGENTTILIWPIPPRREPARPALPLSETEWASRWDDLNADAARAFQAMKTLYARPEQTIKLLREQLRPVVAPDAARAKQLLADLDAESFKTREKATKELEQLGESIEPVLRKALQEKPTLERRRRVERVLAKLAANSSTRVRIGRALEVLEGLNMAESRRFLEELAGGAPDTWLTREAKKGLERLRGRGGK